MTVHVKYVLGIILSILFDANIFTLLSLQIITVFHVHSCRYLWYEVNETTTMGHVVQWIAGDVGVPKNDLLFLLQQGTPLDLRKPAMQYWSEPVRKHIKRILHGILLFLF